jgi:hypothetical protein
MRNWFGSSTTSTGGRERPHRPDGLSARVGDTVSRPTSSPTLEPGLQSGSAHDSGDTYMADMGDDGPVRPLLPAHPRPAGPYRTAVGRPRQLPGTARADNAMTTETGRALLARSPTR